MKKMQGDAPLVVVGTGVAGLMTALLTAQTRPVVLVTKTALQETNTSLAQGGIAAVWRGDDSPALHMEDTIKTGGGINDLQAVELLCHSGPEAIRTLVKLGVDFDKAENGDYRLALEGAHSLPRILHSGGDATGLEIQRALSHAALSHPKIELREYTALTRILTDREGICWVELLDRQKKFTILETSQLVLATGGAGRVFRYTANRPAATGEPMMLAYQAGGELMDLEFFQFHPTALCLEGQPNHLISEAVRGEGAKLVDRNGVAFMAHYHPSLDLAPRDVVSRAIRTEAAKNGQVFLDARKLKAEPVDQRFPNIFQTCMSCGIDPRKDLIPVTPVAHYMMGGLGTDLWGRTSVPGLYGVGEVTRTGVHGASRLASNSLLEGAVFGMQVAQAVGRDLTQPPEAWNRPWPSPIPSFTPAKAPQPLTQDQFRDLMWTKAGLVRDQAGLSELIARLESALGPCPSPLDQAAFELYHMMLYGRLLAQSALMRTESRGSHFRADYPQKDPRQSRSITHSPFHPPRFV